MSTFKISGTVTAVAATKEGNSAKGAWKSGGFTVKESGDFPNEVSLNYMKSGDNVKHFYMPKIGDSVDVEFNIRQREYNGKKYNDLSVWKLTNNTPKQQAAPAAVVEDDMMPF